MSNKYLVLVINPGSTSTKVAVFNDDQLLSEKTLSHNTDIIADFTRINQQLHMRRDVVLNFLADVGISINDLSCVVARGGFLKPISGGTYLVDENMCHELINSPKEHASNLGALIAKEIADSVGIQAFIVDPIIVDEMEPIAKISGLEGIERISIFHALNQKSSARHMAKKLNKDYQECNFIVAHLGGGISVGAHKEGRVIDVNNALDGDGPFSPERVGGLPVCSVIYLCFHSGLSEKEIKRKFVGGGGLTSYLNTNDGRVVEGLIKEKDHKAMLVYEALAYQVSKEIGSCASVLKGKVDAVILTGGLAFSDMLCQWITERVKFIAPVYILPGEGEIKALAAGGVRILKGEERYKLYT